MNNYRDQNGCHNCQHVFTRTEHDESAYRFCTLNAPPRPLCLSVGMNEAPSPDFNNPSWEQVEDKQREDWNNWKEGREVKAFGICDSYVNTN